MKRLTNTLFLLLLTITAVAQDFKLNYAKNVNDVTDFRNLTELDKQLDWHEVSNGAIDGNLDDVMPVKEMLAPTGCCRQTATWSNGPSMKTGS